MYFHFNVITASETKLSKAETKESNTCSWL